MKETKLDWRMNQYIMAQSWDNMIIKYKNLGWIAKVFLPQFIKDDMEKRIKVVNNLG